MNAKLRLMLLFLLFASGADAVELFANVKAPIQVSPVPYTLPPPPAWADFPDPITIEGATLSGIFVGQTVSYNFKPIGSWTYPPLVFQKNMWFEEVAGTPEFPLELYGQGVNQNIGGQDILPSYPGLLYGEVPQIPGIGTGAFSILFDNNVFQFGLDIVGANINLANPRLRDPGTVIMRFFRQDGTVLDILSFEAFNGSAWFYASEAEGPFRGVTITSDDYGGLAYNAFRMPAPGPLALIFLGLCVMAPVLRRPEWCRRLGLAG